MTHLCTPAISMLPLTPQRTALTWEWTKNLETHSPLVWVKWKGGGERTSSQGEREKLSEQCQLKEEKIPFSFPLPATLSFGLHRKGNVLSGLVGSYFLVELLHRKKPHTKNHYSLCAFMINSHDKYFTFGYHSYIFLFRTGKTIFHFLLTCNIFTCFF